MPNQQPNYKCEKVINGFIAVVLIVWGGIKLGAFYDNDWFGTPRLLWFFLFQMILGILLLCQMMLGRYLMFAYAALGLSFFAPLLGRRFPSLLDVYLGGVPVFYLVFYNLPSVVKIFRKEKKVAPREANPGA